jgi:hypothetical protein
VLNEVSTNSTDIDTILEEARAHQAKTFEAKHQIVVLELTASLILRYEQGWNVIHA